MAPRFPTPLTSSNSPACSISLSLSLSFSFSFSLSLSLLLSFSLSPALLLSLSPSLSPSLSLSLSPSLPLSFRVLLSLSLSLSPSLSFSLYLRSLSHTKPPALGFGAGGCGEGVRCLSCAGSARRTRKPTLAPSPAHGTPAALALAADCKCRLHGAPATRWQCDRVPERGRGEGGR